MKPSSWSVCGSNFTKSLNEKERSTQKTGGRGPPWRFTAPTKNTQQLVKQHSGVRLGRNPLYLKAWVTRKAEMNTRIVNVKLLKTTGWSVPSLTRCFSTALRAAETTYLHHRFPPKYTTLLWVSIPRLSYINKSSRKNKSLEATVRWTFSDSFINLWMVFKYWECEPSWACCELLRPDSLVVNAEIHKTMVSFLDHSPLIWLTRCP